MIFGLNGFLNFIKPPPDMVMPAKALQFSTALMESGYMMQLIGATLLVSGLLLVINRFVPLALVLLAPFFVNTASSARCTHMCSACWFAPNNTIKSPNWRVPSETLTYSVRSTFRVYSGLKNPSSGALLKKFIALQKQSCFWMSGSCGLG